MCWLLGEDEAVDMFARHFETLHGRDAGTKAKQQAESIKPSGDHDSHRIWMKVAERIQHLCEEREGRLVGGLSPLTSPTPPQSRIHR
jgi:hypothetical protein